MTGIENINNYVNKIEYDLDEVLKTKMMKSSS